jgi:hypothetical protein
MKTRKVTIHTGEKFDVPQGIQRIDSQSTHGWQVRYHGTKFFADGLAGSAAKALHSATRELLRRIATLPAPVSLKRTPSPRKSSDLPPGISGPVITTSATGAQSAVLSVFLPRFGQEPKVTSIHIGTPNTYTRTRYRQAVAAAVEMRAEALAVYEADATRARRREATALRKALRAAG